MENKYQEIVFDNNIRLLLRPESQNKLSDFDIVSEILVEDQYCLKNSVKKTDKYIVDIGAHIGSFGIRCATIALNAKIFCFEPDKENYSQLVSNINLNNFQNRITPVSLGVAGYLGKKSFYSSKTNSGGHSIFADNKDIVSMIEVTTLENIFKEYNIPHLDLLKLDCEGSEYEILYNTPPKILNNIRTIVLEQHITTDSLKLYDPKGLTNFLSESGFIIETLKTNFYQNEGTFPIIRAINSIKNG